MKTNAYRILIVLLTVMFVGLKLCNVIDWSWWWVISPVIIDLVWGFVTLIVMICVARYEAKHSRERLLNRLGEIKKERDAIINQTGKNNGTN